MSVEHNAQLSKELKVLLKGLPEALETIRIFIVGFVALIITLLEMLVKSFPYHIVGTIQVLKDIEG